MNEKDSEAYIESLKTRGYILNLNNMIRILRQLGNPHHDLPAIHVAGTNGKGSVCRFLEEILLSSGKRVGLYTSPSVESYRERFRLDGEMIDENTFARITGKLRCIDEENSIGVSEFEFLTAMAFDFFHKAKCEIAIFEVGMGGRLDATNVIPAPEASVICNIGLDHTAYLGEDLASIAAEKAGIVKAGCDTILFDQTETVKEVIRLICKERQSPLRVSDRNALRIRRLEGDGSTFDYKDYRALEIGVIGEMQVENAALCIEVVEVLRQKGWNISDQALYTGLKKTRIPFRYQRIQQNPDIIVDGGHNPQAARVLVDTTAHLYPNKRVRFIFGVFKDKDYMEIIRIAAPIAEEFLIVDTAGERGISGSRLVQEIRSKGYPATYMGTVRDALRYCKARWQEDDVILVFGSFSNATGIERLIENKEIL